MRIWFFDSITGELIPSSESDKGQEAPESPREKGKFLEIKYSTTTRAPEYGEHEIPVFDGTTWTVRKDFRELVARYKSTGERVSITEIGVEPDGEYTTIAPEGIVRPVYDTGAWREMTEKEVYAKAYAEDRDKAVAALRHECELLLDSKYYRKEFPFKTKHVRADKDSQDIITKYLVELSLGSRAYPQPWITCENSIVTIDSQEEMISVVSQISAWVEQSILACRVAKSAIDDAGTFEGSWTKFIEFRDAEI